MTKIILTALLFLTALTAAGAAPDIPRDTSFTVSSTAVKIHKKHPEAVVAVADMEGLREHRDVVYSMLEKTPYGRRELHADVFRPDNDSVYPALIMIHGGGWNSGDKRLQEPLATRIAARGYVAIPVEYRLIPEALYPAALHDIKAAVRWARENADAYGIDPDRIAVSGCSAGAQLATLAGVTNGSRRHEGDRRRQRSQSDVQAIINFDGVATFVSPSNIAEARESLAKKGRLTISAKWLGGLYEDAGENWSEASPVLWVTDRSAPICFISSGLPRYSDGRDQLADIYRTKGLHAERHAIDVDIHPFWFFHPWIDTAAGYATDFLDRMFKRQGR